MSYKTIIGVQAASELLINQNCVFVDCRFVLREPEQGFQDYSKSHIPGAVYAHLDRDLSGPVVPGKTGRHPLPDRERLAATFSSWGIDARTQVIAYDDSSGAMAAARLWWLLKWAGHDAAAVLDGGLKKWIEAGYPVAAGQETRQPKEFAPNFRPEMCVDADEVLKMIDQSSYAILDARAADRYCGENETIDPVAGHIRGAISAPFAANQNEAGLFKSPDQLKAHFEEATKGADAGRTVFYCGSGVTAAHSVLAYVHSGKGIPRLYPGSWSDWITHQSRPIARGGSE
ncbi:MAG TPA: sulfurtransferase [Blastocatellia bacterium]|nr:sulfurtransferase [Blastocatellia bacterium]